MRVIFGDYIRSMNGSKTQRIAGWVLSGLLAAFLGFSASGKFLQPPNMAGLLQHIGYTVDTIKPIGAVEVLSAVLFLIPRTAFLGAVLLTAYLGGAVATHVRVGDPFFMPVILGVLVWVAYGLRRPEVIKSAFGLA